MGEGKPLCSAFVAALLKEIIAGRHMHPSILYISRGRTQEVLGAVFRCMVAVILGLPRSEK